MEEQEILAAMREHVARYEAAPQSDSPSPPASVPPPPPAPLPALDLSTLPTLGVPTQVRQTSRLVGQLNPRNPGLLNRAVQMFKRLIQRSLGWYTRSFEPLHDTVAATFEEEARAINRIQDSIRPVQNAIDVLYVSINALHQQVVELHPLKAQVLELKKDQETANALQEALRTAEAATQEQQSPYAELFRGLTPVLDVGCGRGEFLQLLKRSGIEGYGVDSDHAACEVARRKHLRVVEADLFPHLRDLPERSLGGIYCARVIEYLPSNLQLELVSLCATKLKPGGLLVLETINPDSDVPFGRNSHIDPSHLRPIYAEVLRSMVDSNGLHDATVAVLAPRPVPVASAGDPSGSHNGGSSMESAPAADLIAGALAYAIIAHRP